LTGPAAAAKPFSFRTSNLPPSKEGGQGDCGRANKMDAYEQKAVSFRRQPFIKTSLVPATLGYVDIDLNRPAYNVINFFTLKFLHKFGVVHPHHKERISTPLPFLNIDQKWPVEV